MTFFAISGLLNGIAAMSLAILVYSKSPKDPRHWSYGLIGLSIAIWSFSYFSWHMSESRETALFLCRLLMAGAIFIPVTYLHHVLYLTNRIKSLGNVLRSSYLVGFFFLLTDATPYFVTDVQPILSFPFWPQPGVLFHIFLVWWTCIAIYPHYLLFLAYRREQGLRKKQFFYLLIASGVAYLGGATNFPLWYGIEMLPYGTICFTFYVALIAYTLLRYHLLDFSVLVEKGLSYIAVLLLISQPAYPVLLLAQKSVFGSISYRYSIVQLFVHVLTVAGAYQMRLGTRRSIAHTLQRGEGSGLRTLSRFSVKIAGIQNMERLGHEITQTLVKGVRAHAARLFVLDCNKQTYTQVSDFGNAPHVTQESFLVTDDLPRYLAIVQSRIVSWELKRSLENHWKQNVLKDLQRLEADVCFPFIRKNRLLGFCVIGPCPPEALESAESLGFISTLIREAALAIENSILREEVKQSQKLVKQLDRLRSLETMSGSLAYELQNPENSIKSFVQLAALRKNDKDFMNRFQKVLSASAVEIEQLTKEIREYAHDDSLETRTPENLNELLDSCVTFISRHPSYHHIKIEKVLDPEIPQTLLDRQDIRQVIFNILLYFLKNVEEKSQSIFINTQSITSSTGEEWIQIDISEIPNKPTFDILVPSLPTQEGKTSGLLKSSRNLSDPGVQIAQDILHAHQGYVHIYESESQQVLFQMHLPVNNMTVSPHDHPTLDTSTDKESA